MPINFYLPCSLKERERKQKVSFLFNLGDLKLVKPRILIQSKDKVDSRKSSCEFTYKFSTLTAEFKCPGSFQLHYRRRFYNWSGEEPGHWKCPLSFQVICMQPGLITIDLTKHVKVSKNLCTMISLKMFLTLPPKSNNLRSPFP